MRLEDVIAGVLGVPAASLAEDTGPANLPAWDSLAHMRLVTALEDVYGVELGIDEIRAMTTVGAARRLLAGRGAA